ncbi:squamosa promoter-binding-like protein 14 [Diospyros lotus]|uniref:squamosa promoter-binding-like protein 14 n=1 Tax=Diospyros lotus TaxID=55363 RepID=UPI002259EF38|nr:squamosa promoter-binding-like protein 14 [Diospyros lotus]
MDEVGPQIASPLFIHQTLPVRYCEGNPMAKKRGLPIQAPNFQQQSQFTSGFQIREGSWNPKDWGWDSARFVAKPSELDVLQVGSAGPLYSDQQKETVGAIGEVAMSQKKGHVNEDDENLWLRLGGGLNSLDEHMSRPSKRVRSGSPGGGNYPMCQVDNCWEDLSNAKDYHRRHKVCEVHSKASQASVGKQMQRFCQQCSRFHPLSEFDEGKRSCRRRLAGHNRRRRKTQTEDVSSHTVLPGNNVSAGNGDLDIVNLLTTLARIQGNKEVKCTDYSSVANKDQLIQILRKINSLPLPKGLEVKLPVPGNSIWALQEQVPSDNLNAMNRNLASPSTKDLLAVLSATLAASTPDALSVLSQRSNQEVEAKNTNPTCLNKALSLNMQKAESLKFPIVGGEKSSTSYQSPVEDSDCQIQETRSNLPLQLFNSSTEDDNSSKLACARKCFSSDSSNPIEEISPSSSPPVVQNLFPVPTARKPESGRVSTGLELKANVEGSTTQGCVTSIEVFGGSKRGFLNGPFRTFPYQEGSTSSSGSDHSPSSSNSDAPDRTGRMIFKLFGKDPSQLPGTLRSQIYNWLSCSPSEMESYIRPGCVVLTVYISMPSSSWEQLEENLRHCINSLVWDPVTDFWRNGRFLVYTDRQLALHKDGKIHLWKSWRAWHPPEIISVSPLAVVGGQATSLLLKGRNLNIPGTKIHCTQMGGYISTEVLGFSSEETLYDEISVVNFKIRGANPGTLGRCFIEVENGIKGTSFPVIIADATICQELRLLECEFDEDAEVHDTIPEEQVRNSEQPRSKEDVLHFLNELGWLFQRKRSAYVVEVPDYTLVRFRFLFIFSVERDCCALVRTLLDILLHKDLNGKQPLKESLDMLSEIYLLNRAVKRRCRNMVHLLINYSILGGKDSSNYIFPPNLVGPAGVTPLHLAASLSGSVDMVDALTSDPQEFGLHCWYSALDSNGLSPYAYATMRNNHSYNNLVAQKLADRKNAQVSVSIGNEIEKQWLRVSQEHQESSRQLKQGQSACSKCSVVAKRYSNRITGSRGLLHWPYMHSMLAVAAVCVCVCLFLRGQPDIGLVAPFKWENLSYGSI